MFACITIPSFACYEIPLRVVFTDIENRWKMLHYYAKDFFAPIIVTSYLSTSKELSIYVVSDRLYTLTNCTVKLHLYKWESMKPIFALSFNDIVIVSTIN